MVISGFSTHLKSITAFLNIIHLWVNKILVVVVVVVAPLSSVCIVVSVSVR